VVHLLPAMQVSQAMQLLTEIITAHEGSLQASATTRPQQQQPPPDSSTAAAAAESGSTAAEDGMEAVLAAVLDPLLEMVRRSAEVLSPDSPARLDDGGRLDPTAHKVRMTCCGLSSAAAF
jgi:cytoskeletal protein RodZ